MKLFYKVDPERYQELMDAVRNRFGLHAAVDEEKTILRAKDTSAIETVVGSFDPSSGEAAMVRVVLNEKSLRAEFDAILGQPFLVK